MQRQPGRMGPRGSSRRVLHSLALVWGPLQHGGHLQQGAVVPELGQHLEQQHDGAVHVPGEAARPVDLVHGDPPDALWDGAEGFWEGGLQLELPWCQKGLCPTPTSLAPPLQMARKDARAAMHPLSSERLHGTRSCDLPLWEALQLIRCNHWEKLTAHLSAQVPIQQ